MCSRTRLTSLHDEATSSRPIDRLIKYTLLMTCRALLCIMYTAASIHDKARALLPLFILQPGFSGGMRDYIAQLGNPMSHRARHIESGRFTLDLLYGLLRSSRRRYLRPL